MSMEGTITVTQNGLGRTAVRTRQSSGVRWRMALVSNFIVTTDLPSDIIGRDIQLFLERGFARACMSTLGSVRFCRYCGRKKGSRASQSLNS